MIQTLALPRPPRRACLLTVLSLACLVGFAAPVRAHEGEDHSQDKKAAPTATAGPAAVPAGSAAREAPMRMNDGSLFVPKPVQRRLGLQTVRVVVGALQATVELNGRVVAQPGAGGRVQATQAGTVLAGPRGFPLPGMTVREGDVLALLRPSIGNLERSGQKAELADLSAQLTLAEQRAARLAQLEGSVPAKEVLAARVEAQALRERLNARRGSADALLPLTAPTSGVVSAMQVVLGEVVDAKDLLFEIVDPNRLAVEALAYDAALPSRLSGADGVAGDLRLKLRLVGAGLQLREQALPVIFAVVSSSGALAVGQSVKVFAHANTNQSGIAVPRSALSTNSAGETVVWLHTEPERFEPRRISQRALDADRVAVGAGLEAGDRVVTSGAHLLAQVR